MKWWKQSEVIPFTDVQFQKIINGFVFMCPSSIRTKKRKTQNSREKTQQSMPVSARDISFIKRGIKGPLLNTLLSQIRKPLLEKHTYHRAEDKDNVEVIVGDILTHSNLSDDFFDLIVFKKRNDMPDTEAIYYYIRNAFAHGSFEVCIDKGEKIYILESSKDGNIKAQMRLKERTLLRYMELAAMNTEEIRALQKSKKK